MLKLLGLYRLLRNKDELRSGKSWPCSPLFSNIERASRRHIYFPPYQTLIWDIMALISHLSCTLDNETVNYLGKLKLYKNTVHTLHRPIPGIVETSGWQSFYRFLLPCPPLYRSLHQEKGRIWSWQRSWIGFPWRYNTLIVIDLKLRGCGNWGLAVCWFVCLFVNVFVCAFLCPHLIFS